MPTDPYLVDLLKENFYAKKSPVLGRLTVVLRGHLDQRGLELIRQLSRVVAAGEVHELLVVDEPGAGPGQVINRVAALGFLEFVTSGVLLVGDEVLINDQAVGHLAGYDLTHMPNHMNLVISAPRMISGVDLGLELGATIKFIMPDPGDR
jgi:hypothetical protein